jgi:large subunit ribosomal protein L30
MSKANVKQIKITQLKSGFGRLQSHRDCLRGLGLRRIHQTISVQDTPENRGMINKVSYMLRVEEN